MPELVTIPNSYFELLFEYEKPIVRLWTNRAEIVERLFDGFKPYDASVDDIEVIDVGKNSEKGIKFKIPQKKASFFVGATACKFTQDNANGTQ